MEITVVLISISLMIATGFLIAFLWNVNSGQYDDTYSPAVRMLFDKKKKSTQAKKIKHEIIPRAKRPAKKI